MGDLNDILDLARSMGLVLGLAFYVAIVIWTYKDARKRTDDPIMVATFTAISMLPLFGVLIYMLVRPAEYLADVRERELEIRALERQLGRQERCPYCKSHIEGEYLSCPVCTTKLRQSCTGCERPLDPRWVMCPFCETEVPQGGRGPGGGGGGRGPSTPGGSGGGGDARRSTVARETKPRRSEPRSTRETSGSKTSTTKPERGTSPRSPKVTPREDDIRTEPFGPNGSRTEAGQTAADVTLI
ncbi:MAG: hypothetical protein JWM98_1161 [Thermoleophilia bacterium]|nr:hypothetical protein [Thermoleophilia bacterium]